MVDAASSQGGGGLTIWIMLIVLVGAMYFFMIRPQQRRRREVEAMQSGMGPGDEVVTIGGLHGMVHAVDDETVLLEIAPDVVVRFARAAISRVVAPAESFEDDTADEETADGGEADDDDVETTARKIVDS